MITGDDFLACANRWATLREDGGGGEAVWRTAICRAYYGAFHIGLALINDDMQIQFPGGRNKRNEHELVQQALKNAGSATALKAGGILGALHEYRKAADYKIGVTTHGERDLAMQCVAMAQEVKTILGSYSPLQIAEMKDRIQKFIDRLQGRA